MQKEILKSVLKKNMSDKNKNTGKSLSDFLRYREGKMTGEERNSFEKELQKNPFANEASEGFESLSPGDILSDLNKIESRIPKAKTNVKGFVIYRIAASVAVLMAISTIFILVQKDKNDVQLAKYEKASEPFEISKQEPVIQRIAENIKTGPAITISRKKEESAASGGAAAEKKQEDIVAKDLVAEKKVVFDSIADREVKPTEIYLAEEKMAAPAAMAKAKSTAFSQRQVMFDTSVSALEEVVVVGYGASSKKDTETGYTAPQPVTGKAAFDKYIEENIHRPDTITEGQRVIVVINFTVLSNGRLDSIKIIRSPGKAFSDEAIRLIKSGPDWKPAEENGKAIDEEVRLRIVFR
jgi:TonB family protein